MYLNPYNEPTSSIEGPGFAASTTVALATGADSYPDPLPDGLIEVQFAAWSIRLQWDYQFAMYHGYPFTATAIIYNPDGTVLDVMTLDVPDVDGGSGLCAGTVSNGTIYTGAQEGQTGALITYTHTHATNSLGQDVPLWDSYWYENIVHPRAFFPVSKIQIPPGCSVKVEAPEFVTWFLYLTSSNNVTAFWESTPPVVKFTSRGVSADDYGPDPDRITAMTEYPIWPEVSSFEYWWFDSAANIWRHTSGPIMVGEFFSSQAIYILIKDVDGGQSMTKYPLLIGEWDLETGSETTTKAGHALAAVERFPTLFYILDAYGNYTNKLTIPQHIEIMDVVGGVQTSLFTPLHELPELEGDYGLARSPSLITLKHPKDTLVYFGIRNFRNYRRLSPTGGTMGPDFPVGMDNTWFSRDQGKHWQPGGYIFTSPNIRTATLIDLADGALAVVAVSSDAWPAGAYDGTVTRKLLFKRTVSVTSSDGVTLNPVWPTDADAIEIADVDRVEKWKLRQEPSGFIVATNGRGARYTSATANPTSPADWTYSEDTVTP